MQMSDVTDAAKTADSATATKGEDGKPPVESKDAKISKDVKPDSSTEEMPWHKDPRFQTFLKDTKTYDKLSKILKDNDLDDPDDLAELVNSGKAVKGRISDPAKIEELIAKAAKLDSYEEYWAAEKAKRQKAEEDPGERADRLERELEKERRRKVHEDNQKKQMEATKAAISQYEKDVTDLIAEVGVAKEHSPFVLQLFGVGNPSNDVDITDKKAIKKLVADGIKQVEAFKQLIIADYLKGKEGIVKTGTGTEAVAGEKPTKIGLKDAHKLAKEQIGAMFRGIAGG